MTDLDAWFANLERDTREAERFLVVLAICQCLLRTRALSRSWTKS